MSNILQDSGYFDGPIQSFHMKDMMRLYSQGVSIEEIAEGYGLDEGDVSRVLIHGLDSK